MIGGILVDQPNHRVDGQLRHCFFDRLIGGGAFFSFGAPDVSVAGRALELSFGVARLPVASWSLTSSLSSLIALSSLPSSLVPSRGPTVPGEVSALSAIKAFDVRRARGDGVYVHQDRLIA